MGIGDWGLGIGQFAVGAVKFIMQATGETTIEKMNRDASLAFTSKTKAMIKKLTGSESTDGNDPSPDSPEGEGGNPSNNPSPDSPEGEGGNPSNNQGGGDSGSIIDGTDEG